MLDAQIQAHAQRHHACDVKTYLPPSLAAGLAVRYQPRVVRSPAAHAPGVRSGRSCHTQPTRPWESPVRPAVGSGRSSHTRLQQPASRSASGRVLSPPYAAVRPNARSTGARGQRASRPASGAHPTRGRPVCCRHALVRARPVHQPARAAKAHCGGNPTATARHRQPPPSRPTSSWHPVAPTRSRARARRPRSQPCSPCLHQRASASSWHPASASTL